MPRTLAVMGLACGIACAALFAQGSPTFRTDTHFVEVNVVVHDNTGKPVTGLPRDDFTLLEDGKEQPIEMFPQTDACWSRTARSPPPRLRRSHPHRPRAATSATGLKQECAPERSPPSCSIASTRRSRISVPRAQIAQFLGQIRQDDRVAL